MLAALVLAAVVQTQVMTVTDGTAPLARAGVTYITEAGAATTIHTDTQGHAAVPPHSVRAHIAANGCAVAGARGDIDTTQGSLRTSAISPRAALRVTLSPRLAVRISEGAGIRVPFLNELLRGFQSGPYCFFPTERCFLSEAHLYRGASIGPETARAWHLTSSTRS